MMIDEVHSGVRQITRANYGQWNADNSLTSSNREVTCKSYEATMHEGTIQRLDLAFLHAPDC